MRTRVQDMHFTIDAQGMLLPAMHVISSNQSPRPPHTTIDLIVIHNISLPPGQFAGNAVIDFFQNQLDYSSHPYFLSLQNIQVSAHMFIRRDGEIIQFVPFSQRAWHAGISEFQGRANCNDFSIGIELEGADNVPYTENQYNQLANLCITLMKHYTGITPERIVGHSDIAPGRKTDPGEAFDWQVFRDLLSESVL